MWGPDLTIRAPYITGAREGGLEERGLQGSEHTDAHTHKHTLAQGSGGGDFNAHVKMQTCTPQRREDVCADGQAEADGLHFRAEKKAKKKILRSVAF